MVRLNGSAVDLVHEVLHYRAVRCGDEFEKFREIRCGRDSLNELARRADFLGELDRTRHSCACEVRVKVNENTRTKRVKTNK